MATSQIQEGFRIDVFLTPKQHQILKEITHYTKKTIEQFLSDCLEGELEMLVENPEVFGWLMKQIYNNKTDRTPVKKEGRIKFSLDVKLPRNKFDIISAMQMLAEKYKPSYFQGCLEDDVRAILEVLDKIPDDIRHRLEAEWKKEIGY